MDDLIWKDFVSVPLRLSSLNLSMKIDKLCVSSSLYFFTFTCTPLNEALLNWMLFSKILFALKREVLILSTKISVSWWWSLIWTSFKITVPKIDKSTFLIAKLVPKFSFKSSVTTVASWVCIEGIEKIMKRDTNTSTRYLKDFTSIFSVFLIDFKLN